MKSPTYYLGRVAALAITVAVVPCALADDDLAEMSMEELLGVEVTSVSRRAEPLHRAAAAVFVVSDDDIRRSGATSIPEALRMVPGLRVARIDASRWAISARGFSGQFANKLLVMIDGRVVYSPLFAGVFWDVQDTLLSDIDRIEVIRGPGASLWGANAVNGVINIITKHSRDTPGSEIHAATGDQERLALSFRHGGAFGARSTYRAWAKGFRRDETVIAATGDDGVDDWEQLRAGLRVDWEGGGRHLWSIQGEFYDGETGNAVTLIDSAPPFLLPMETDESVQGFFLMGEWVRRGSPDSEMRLKAYLEGADRLMAILDTERRTLDLDFQHGVPLGDAVRLLWGAGYRTHDLTMSDESFTIGFDNPPESVDLLSSFLQFDATIIADRLGLTAGTKISDNDFTGTEVQPTFRLHWTPDKAHTAWAAVSRAVHTASVVEQHSASHIPLDLESPLPVLGRFIGNEDVDSESLVSYELGYRYRPGNDLRLDAALFYNDYDDVLAASPTDMLCQPSGIALSANPLCVFTAVYLEQPFPFTNRATAEAEGGEVVVDWSITEHARVSLAYSYLDFEITTLPGEIGGFGSGADPEHQVSLRLGGEPGASVTLDGWLRFVDGTRPLFRDPIDSYWTLDVRAAWSPLDSLEIALVGRNLIENEHVEFSSELFTESPVQAIPRSIHLELTYGF